MKIICPRCSAQREDGVHCPFCGYGLRADPVYLLGGRIADGVAATLAGLIPGGLLVGDSLTGYRWAQVFYVASAVLVMELLAFFTVLRPYTTLRRAMAAVYFLYTFAATVAFGCTGLVGLGTGDTGYALIALLIIIGVLLLQGTVWFLAYRRPG